MRLKLTELQLSLRMAYCRKNITRLTLRGLTILSHRIGHCTLLMKNPTTPNVSLSQYRQSISKLKSTFSKFESLVWDET